MRATNDTIAATATAPGEAGIAVIRISGPDAIAVACRVFRTANGAMPADPDGYTVRYGVLIDRSCGDVVDDVVLTVFRAPRSYTAEDVVEISGHGGRASSLRALELVLASGARLAEPGEFTFRAFMNGRIDLAQAEAVADVVRSRTEAARRASHYQLRGGLSERVAALRDELIGALAAIEVTIDFSDEVGDLDYERLAKSVGGVATELDRLLAGEGRGRILREGLRVAIVGRPNVGKSSLLNRLLRTDRAIVTDVPGTTRDLIEESANIGGFPITLVDTAGMRDTNDPVERIGVERANQASEVADVILLVLDASTPLTDEDRELSERLNVNEDARVIVVANKIDLVHFANRGTLVGRDDVQISAVTGAGIEELERRIVEIAGGGVGPDETLVTNVRHFAALRAARSSLAEALATIDCRMPGDFVAIDLRGALDALGAITGETAPDEVIHRIFRDFCVGK